MAAKRLDRGRPTPLWDDRPQLPPSAALAWNGGAELDSARQLGPMGVPLAIQPSEVLAWCELNGIDCVEDRLDVWTAVLVFNEVRNAQPSSID